MSSFMVGILYSTVIDHVLQQITPKRLQQAQKVCNLPFCLSLLCQDVTETHSPAVSINNEIRFGTTSSSPLGYSSVWAFLWTPTCPGDSPRLVGPQALSKVLLTLDPHDHIQQNIVPQMVSGPCSDRLATVYLQCSTWDRFSVNTTVNLSEGC